MCGTRTSGIERVEPRSNRLVHRRDSAYDLISWRAMLTGLAGVEGGAQVLPFVNLFCGQPSMYWWEDSMGTVHEVAQGEGGEQGDAMMPLLFALGQRPALELNRQLRPGELLFAFLDDIYVVCLPDRVGVIFTLLETALWEHARIQHAGKTKVWNRAGTRPEACDFLERRAQLVSEQQPRVGRGGDDVPSVERGVKILGTPRGHPEYVSHQLRVVCEHQQVLLDRIPDLPDVQSAWALLLHCAAARANYFIRVVPPELSQEFANSHDEVFVSSVGGATNIVQPTCS